MEIQELAIGLIESDPARFQSRDPEFENADDSDLSDVRVFDADFAGLISVWRDSGGGKIYVVDGHRRGSCASAGEGTRFRE